MPYKLLVEAAAAVCIGGAIGIAVWHGMESWTWIVLAVPLLWALSRSPLSGWLLWLSYFLGGSRSIIEAVVGFFPGHGLISGVAVWAVGGLILSLPFYLASRRRRRRPLADALRVMAALLAVSVPPIGMFGYATPLVVAGTLFPGFGLAGMLLTIGAFGVAAAIPGSCSNWKASRPTAAASAAIVALVIAAHATEQPVSKPANLVGLNTVFEGYDDPIKFSQVYNQNRHLTEITLEAIEAAPRGTMIVLPENAVGPWGAGAEYIWSPVQEAAQEAGVTVIAGTLLPEGDKHYWNAVAIMGEQQGMAWARQPIPLGMWNPFSSGASAKLDWTRLGGVQTPAGAINLLICYEQLLPWPVIWSFMGPQSPQAIVAISNHWWAPAGSITPELQQQATAAWARLFSVPVVEANNTAP